MDDGPARWLERNPDIVRCLKFGLSKHFTNEADLRNMVHGGTITP